MRTVETPLKPQLFSDGLATFCQVINTAGKGDLPKYTAQAFLSVPFREQSVGDVRYYAALQADSKIAKVIRIPRVAGIQPAGDLVTLAGDTRQYKVQKLSKNTLTVPESLDITLEVSKQTYTILEEAAEDDDTGV